MIYNTTETALWLNKTVCVPPLGGAEVPEYLLQMKVAKHLMATGALSHEPAKPKPAAVPVAPVPKASRKRASHG